MSHINDDDLAAREDELKALDRLLAADSDVTPSADFSARVLSAVADERPRRRWLGFLAPAVVASAALVVALSLQTTAPSDDELFLAEHQEMFAELEMYQSLDAVEDFDAIQELGETP